MPDRLPLPPSRPLIGAWVNIDHAHIAAIAGRSGFDYVVFDMQHGLCVEASLPGLLSAVEATPAASVVRAPSADATILGKILDLGADAVIIPMIENAAHARAAVEACLYPPRGRRSWGPTRVGARFTDYFSQAESALRLFPMIEMTSALEDCEEIAALPGVAGLFVGPADLSISIGLRPGRHQDDQRFQEALARVVAACRARGRFAGIQAERALARRRMDEGFDFLTVAMDSSDLEASFAQALAAAR